MIQRCSVRISMYILMVIGYHAHTAQIHDHWYVKAEAELQPKSQQWKTYWLMIPAYNDRAFVQAQAKEHLAYDPQTETGKFRYVDPQRISKRNTFEPLPKGLRYWQSDYVLNRKTVRNYPHGQPFQWDQQKGAHLPSTGRGSPWNPQQAPDAQPPSIEDVIKQPESLLEQNATIRIATANTLAEGPYNRFASVKQMPLEVRKHHFRVAQQNPYIFWGADIICVQEWDQQFKDFTDYGYLGEQVNKGMTTGIFYDQKRWQNMTSETLNIQNKKQKIATLSGNKQRITIASCHIPSAPQEQALYTLQQVYDAAQNQKNNNSSNGIILAGDFNYNTYDRKYKTYTPRDTNPKSYNNLAQALSPLEDAAAAHGAQKIPTAYDNGYTRMDYIWYTPSLTCTSFSMFPPQDNLEVLIKHTQPPQGQAAYRYHFSDHAVLRAGFTLSKGTDSKHIGQSLKSLHTSLDHLSQKVTT